MKKLVLAFSLVMLTVFAAGCGGEKGPVREVVIDMGPGMVFAPTEITGTVGERLLIKSTNVDGAMDHNLVVLGKKLLLRPNKSGQIIVSLTKAGTFEILCTLPGHTEAGMVGVLKVEAEQP